MNVIFRIHCVKNLKSTVVFYISQAARSKGLFCITVQGILSSVYLDGQILHGWKMIPIPFHNLNQMPNLSFEMHHTKKRSEKFNLTHGQCSNFFQHALG